MNDMMEQLNECGKNTFSTIQYIKKKIKILYICQDIIENYHDSFFSCRKNLKLTMACMSFDPGLS